jgi:hypothetical protein
VIDKSKTQDGYGSTCNRRGLLDAGARAAGNYLAVARDKHGNVKWVDRIHNLITDEGLRRLLSTTLGGASGDAKINTWYLGLVGATPTFDGANTMASHSGWTEVQAYDGTARPTWTPGAATTSISNSASAAVFTCSTNGTVIAGAFLASDSTKGGTTGYLFAAGDTLTVIADYSLSRA